MTVSQYFFKEKLQYCLAACSTLWLPLPVSSSAYNFFAGCRTPKPNLLHSSELRAQRTWHYLLVSARVELSPCQLIVAVAGWDRPPVPSTCKQQSPELGSVPAFKAKKKSRVNDQLTTVCWSLNCIECFEMCLFIFENYKILIIIIK